ncbi:MAG: Nif3-like dinuclear metal center hexameric protein [Firmicutes bacterium]|nr:Nif3-like dinuclear metal center hexameric protein [Bacillota bacterium]
MVVVKQVASWMEAWAPRWMAMQDDPVGLGIGDPQATVETVLVALEVTPAVLEEAVAQHAQLIVTHHAPLFHRLASLNEADAHQRLIRRLVENGIHVYNAHTNLDIAPGGINDLLAQRLGLQPTQLLAPTGHLRLLKVVTFVPSQAAEAVRMAMAEAGAGFMGAYSHTTFTASGTGRFLPTEGAHPAIGTVGRLEEVPEERIESIVRTDQAQAVEKAIRRAHPYEEPAIDFFEEAFSPEIGLGRVGSTPEPLTLAEWVDRVRERLNLAHLAVCGELERPIHRVALCGGSGGSLIGDAIAAGADLFITGDINHHAAWEANEAGMALIDATHYATEQVMVEAVTTYLRRCAKQEGLTLRVEPAQSAVPPFSMI